MASRADREGSAVDLTEGSEWQAWRRHRLRIYLLVLLSTLAILACMATFALRPLQGELGRQLQDAAQAMLDHSGRMFDARSRRLLRHAEGLAADGPLGLILADTQVDSQRLADRLHALLGGIEELTGIAVLDSEGRWLSRVGQVPVLLERGLPSVGVRPVRLALDDTGLLYTLPLPDSLGRANYWLQVTYESTSFRELMAPDAADGPVPFVVADDEAFFTPVAARVQLQACGGFRELQQHGCQGQATLLTRPLAGGDWSLAMMLDESAGRESLVTALRWLPVIIAVVAAGLLLLTASVMRPLNGLFAHTGRLYEMSARDEMTGLSNRRHLMHALDVELARAARHHLALNVMLLDIDRFKTINDTYGHAVGDLAIKEVADAVVSLSRSEDVTARLGGDEFVVVQSDVDLDGAARFAERLRQTVSRIHLDASGDWVRLSVSIGIAHVPADQVTRVSRERLLGIADRALYKAKAAGRNRVAARGLRETPHTAAHNS